MYSQRNKGLLFQKVSQTRLCSITEVCIQQTKSKADDTLNILLRESPRAVVAAVVCTVRREYIPVLLHSPGKCG